MKDIIKIAGISLILLIAFTACDKYEWKGKETELVPVYAVSNLELSSASGLVNAVNSINVYKNQKLHIEMHGRLAFSDALVNYEDKTNSTEYAFSYSLKKSLVYIKDLKAPKAKQERGTIENPVYEYKAVKSTHSGTLNIKGKDKASGNDVVISFNISLKDAKEYY